MSVHKKTAAFLTSLLLLVPAASLTGGYVLAEDTSETTETQQDTNSQEYTVSGGFSYSLTSEGTVCIESCSLTDEALVIPDTIDGIAVTELGKKAFGDDPTACPFTSVSIPAGVNYISADNPFIYCEKLTEITVSADNKDFCAVDGVLFSADMKKLICYPIAKPGSAFTIPDGVETIGSSGLYSTQLSEIKFPSSLTTVSDFGLSYNEKLTAADISATKTDTLGQAAFMSCSVLSDVKLPETLTEIQAGAFLGCERLKEITLPQSLTTVGQFAFKDTGLKSVTVPDSVVDIGYSAFGYYTDENGEEKADSDFTIIGTYGSAAHRYCTDSDEEYDYSNNFTFKTEEEQNAVQELIDLEKKPFGDYEYAQVDDYAVITSCTSTDAVLNVPAEIEGLPVKSIYPAAFSSCGSVEIIVPEGVETIREMAFFNCTSVKSIVLPASMQNVGGHAFDTCSSLETINTGGTVTFGSVVFYGCTSLRSVTISGNCTTLEGDAFFSDCSALEEIVITNGNGSFSSKDGVLYSKDGTELIAYPEAKSGKSFKIPKGVKKIADYAFLDCQDLKDVVMSKELEEIGDYSFYGCTNLKKFRCYDSLKTIGEYAVGFCYNSEADTQNGETEDTPVEGFKLYTNKNSAAYNYAKKNSLTVVTGTVRLFGSNITIWAAVTMAAAAVLAVFGAVFAAVKRSLRKKKEKRSDAERRVKIEEKRKKRQEEKSEDNDEN